ncbi:MAG: NB-ARC domain-containing protein, partial [Rickettsiella sp.]|nr:NB-ARC domain-containing protein [Rickettsiella sp.]
MQTIINSNHSVSIVNPRNKRSDDNPSKPAVAEISEIWLSQEDLADIARIEYNSFKAKSISVSSDFEIIGPSLHELFWQLEKFRYRTRQYRVHRLTLIINLDQNHWVTLLISYKHPNLRDGYYIDSLGNRLSDSYLEYLLRFQIPQATFNENIIQQRDTYNCGLWALENAADLNRMLDENKPLNWVIEQFKRPRSSSYFGERRRLLFLKLDSDLERQERLGFVAITDHLENQAPPPKRMKVESENEKITKLLDIFVETFMNAFIKRLATYYLTAKGERLTIEALTTELKTGATAALMGGVIAQSITGTIPSLVASLRTISVKYYLPKGKAQKITRVFSNVSQGELSRILSEAAVAIFQSFENQFMHVTDKAGDKMAMEKLAEDAAGRISNYVANSAFEGDLQITSDLIVEGVLYGQSEKFFDPSFKPTRIRIAGYSLQDLFSNKITTAHIYEKVGLIVNSQAGDKFYKKIGTNMDGTKYGYRLLLSMEKEQNGELKETFKSRYQQQETLFEEETDFQRNLKDYTYLLQSVSCQQQSQRILDTIKNRYPVEATKNLITAKPQGIFFDLRKPVENFTGRKDALAELHRLLITGRTTAIVTSLSNLLMNPSSTTSNLPTSGTQTTISGLGGIGKTQLALQYAVLHATDYDNNVLWINGETKEELAYSFNKLATKFDLPTKDRYGQKKETVEIAETIYEYFSDKKSLFIFDNVEDYQKVEAFFPKVMVGNKPSLIITSRYQNWNNVAPVINLAVFTEEETLELVKKGLNLNDNTHDEKIKELNTLLQGLPLALQQSIAFINNEQLFGPFTVQNYIDLYKEKNKDLLAFEFASYSNDPYAKTVYTTWKITLEKIKQIPEGKLALEILNIMAYLCPDNISNLPFLQLYPTNTRQLKSAINLLKSYSMLSDGSQKYRLSIHRLVQQVVRINLEQDVMEFGEIAKKTEKILSRYITDIEIRFHYLHFLLHVADNRKLKSKLRLQTTFNKLFEILTEHEVERLYYFFDLAYITYSKQKYIDILGEALLCYIKKLSPILINQVFTYLEKQWQRGILTNEELEYIMDYRFSIGNSPRNFFRFSVIPAQRERQIAISEMLIEFKKKTFKKVAVPSCSQANRERRNINQCALKATKEYDEKKIKYLHLETIRQVTRFVSTSLFTENFLISLLHGDWDSIAINFGLLGGSHFLGKISNKLFVMGETLTLDEKIIFEKDLALEHKAAMSILFNEEIITAGKRRFLGKTLKVVSPFVARGTALFFAYNFAKDIKAYRAGDKEALPNAILDGTIIGIDVTESTIEGAEFLGYVAGISEFTGPVGEGVILVFWLGLEGYHAGKQVHALEKYVHLTRSEEFLQGLRAFFHFSPSDYLEIRASNNQLVNNAINFLKTHSVIKRYVFSAWDLERTLHTNSKVFLNRRINITLSDTMPDEPNEGNLICLSGTPTDHLTRADRLKVYLPFENQRSKTFIYLCEKAIGIEYLVNRTGDVTLIGLDQGEDKAIVLSDLPSIFLVNNGRKDYKADNSLFVLQGNVTSGWLRGGRGDNVVSLDDFHLQTSQYSLLDTGGFLCGKNTSYASDLHCMVNTSLKLENIQRIYGRKNKKDVFYPTDSLNYIDGYGGETIDQPDIVYVTQQVNKTLSVVLRTNTLVVFEQSNNTTVELVDYRIPNNQTGEVRIQFPASSRTQHRLFFDFTLTDVKNIDINSDTIYLLISPIPDTTEKILSVAISDNDPMTENKNTTSLILSENIYFFFQDQLEIKLLSTKQIYAKVQSNQTVEEIINYFFKITELLEKSFFIQLFDNKTVSIGQGNDEIFYINGLSESHLVGNGGENVYIISPTNNTNFPLPGIVLYDLDKEKMSELLAPRDTLDLRELVKNVKNTCFEQIITPRVLQNGKDLIINLNAHYYNLSGQGLCILLSGTTWLIANITLKNALTDYWYKKVDVFLDDVPMSIEVTEDNKWYLTREPLVFDTNKNIIILTEKDIKSESDPVILKTIGNYTFLRKNDSDLILTNVLSANITHWDLCTIIFSQFFQISTMREKVLLTTLHFFDQEIALANYEEQINTANNFSYVFAQAMVASNDSVLLRVTRNENESQARQIKLTNQLSRYRRQANDNIATSTAMRSLPLFYDLFAWGKNFIERFVSPLIAARVTVSELNEPSYISVERMEDTNIDATAHQYLECYEAKETKKNRSRLHERKAHKIKHSTADSPSEKKLAVVTNIYQEGGNKSKPSFTKLPYIGSRSVKFFHKQKIKVPVASIKECSVQAKKFSKPHT